MSEHLVLRHRDLIRRLKRSKFAKDQSMPQKGRERFALAVKDLGRALKPDLIYIDESQLKFVEESLSMVGCQGGWYTDILIIATFIKVHSKLSTY